MKTFVKSTVIVAAVLAFQFQISDGQEKQETKYKNAPKVVPNTTEEMQTPGFWISRLKGDPDRVILTPSQIAEKNRGTQRMRERIKKLKDINGDPYSIDRVIRKNDMTGVQYRIENPLTIKTFPGDSLRARLRTHREFFDRRTYYDDRRMEFDDDKKNELYAKTDAESIPDVITPRYGIVSTHTMNRVLPTSEEAYGRPGDWYTKGLQSASCDVAMPVAILHESKDKDWYYVRTEDSFGWTQAANVAVGSPNEIRNYVDAKDFIVALTHTIPVYGNDTFDLFLTHLYMSSKFKLIEKTGRGYHVLVPFRDANGYVKFVDGWVKPDAKVSVGYQQFTQRNVFNTLFNLLYRPYSWNDADHEWNCCGFMRVVLKTFGIKNGNWPAFEMHYSDNVFVFPADTPREKKYEYLNKCEPGMCLVGGDGHMNMFLGNVNGRNYVIHMGGYDYYAEDGTVMMYRRVNVNDTELDGNYNVDNWTKISSLKP